MIAVVQRVSSAKVSAKDGSFEPRSIGRGLVVLLGVADSDKESDAVYLAKKIPALRIFPDEKGKFDKSLADAGGEVLVISQFTLLGNCKGGRRPDFTCAAAPDKAKPLYDKFVTLLKETGAVIKTGEFGALMLAEINNDGPVTLIVDSERKLN
jgi:D-tyrosyl-tRNA(Tyr) deacylase